VSDSNGHSSLFPSRNTHSELAIGPLDASHRASPEYHSPEMSNQPPRHNPAGQSRFAMSIPVDE
jgi:hypothetical protein